MDLVPLPTTPELSPRILTPAYNGMQFEQLRADIATRLRRVCGQMTPEQFDSLVGDICAMKIRWARSEAPSR